MSIKIIILTVCSRVVTWGLEIDFHVSPAFKTEFYARQPAVSLQVQNGNKSYLFSAFSSLHVKAQGALLALHSKTAAPD